MKKFLYLLSLLLLTSLPCKPYVTSEGVPGFAYFTSFNCRGFVNTFTDMWTRRNEQLILALKEGDSARFKKLCTANDLGDAPIIMLSVIEDNQAEMFIALTQLGEDGKKINLARTFKFYCDNEKTCPKKFQDVLRRLMAHKENALAMFKLLHLHEIPALSIEFEGQATLLHLAAAQEFEGTEAAQELLAFFQKHIDELAPDKDGNIALHWAAAQQTNPSLLAQLATPESKKTQNNLGDTPAHVALLVNRSEDDVRLLLDENVKQTPNASGNTLLHIALEQERSPEFIGEVAKHVNPLLANNKGEKPLYIARSMQEATCGDNSVGELCLYWSAIKEILEERYQEGIRRKRIERLQEEEIKLQEVQAQMKEEQEENVTKLREIEAEQAQLKQELDASNLKVENLKQKAVKQEALLKAELARKAAMDIRFRDLV